MGCILPYFHSNLTLGYFWLFSLHVGLLMLSIPIWTSWNRDGPPFFTLYRGGLSACKSGQLQLGELTGLENQGQLQWEVCPIPSMYGVFTYIYHKNQPNVGEYTIHGSYGC